MVENNVIINALNRRYDQMRLDAQNKAFEINNALEQDPNWQNNRYAIKSLKLEIARAEYEEKNSEIPTLKRKLEILTNERAKILKDKNLTEADLTVNYNCKICNDSGFINGGGICECYHKNLTAVCEQILNIQTPELPSFALFSENTENNKKLKTLFTDYVDKFPPEKIKNLIFTGKPGTGKTFSAGCIAKALKDKNLNVIYLSAVKLNDLFLTYHTSSISDKQAIFALLTTCDLLVIDDLGTEPILKNVTVEYLTATLSERLSSKAPFVITTNLNLEEIKTRYTERLSSRISGSETARIAFNGVDMRIKK